MSGRRQGYRGAQRDLQQIAVAVVGSAAAAQVIHRETANPTDPQRVLVRTFPEVASAEHAVVDAAREYYRTGGQAHHALMDAVQQLERSQLAAAGQQAVAPSTCYCGTGRAHETGLGYHCGRAARDSASDSGSS